MRASKACKKNTFCSSTFIDWSDFFTFSLNRKVYLYNIEVRMMRFSLLESSYNYLSFVADRMLNVTVVFHEGFIFLLSKMR